MRTILSFLVFLVLVSETRAQGNEEVQRLVQEGIDLHDKGDYEGAIKKYDQAIKIDEKSFEANYEKTYTLYEQGNKKECISLCKKMLKNFSAHPSLGMIYIQYGSSLDDLGKASDALKVYEEGIKNYPDEYLLYFNKGLTLHKMNKTEDALIAYQEAMKLKPLHSSSNYYTGILLQSSNKIPATLAYLTFLAIEPQTKRSVDAFESVNQVLNANVKRDGKSITIFIDPSILGKKKKRNAENDFSLEEMTLSLLSALDSSKNIDSIAPGPVNKMSFKIQSLISTLAGSVKTGKGFYWEHYVPFFIAMKEKEQVETLSHLLFLQSKEEDNNKWLADNEDKVDQFYDWLKGYQWK